MSGKILTENGLVDEVLWDTIRQFGKGKSPGDLGRYMQSYNKPTPQTTVQTAPRMATPATVTQPSIIQKPSAAKPGLTTDYLQNLNKPIQQPVQANPVVQTPVSQPPVIPQPVVQPPVIPQPVSQPPVIPQPAAPKPYAGPVPPVIPSPAPVQTPKATLISPQTKVKPQIQKQNRPRKSAIIKPAKGKSGVLELEETITKEQLKDIIKNVAKVLKESQ